MVWVWMGIGAAIALVALLLFIRTINQVDDRDATNRRRQYEAETAMVRAVQDTVSAMFDTVRRQR